MNIGHEVINDAINAGISDMVTVLYYGAAIVIVIALRMVKVSLDTAKYRR